MADKDLTTQMGGFAASPTTEKDVLGYFVPQTEIQKIEPHGITIEQALENQLRHLKRRGLNKGKTAEEIRSSQRPYKRAIEQLENLVSEEPVKINGDSHTSHPKPALIG